MNKLNKHRENFLVLAKFEKRLTDAGRPKIAAFVRKQSLIQLNKMVVAQAAMSRYV
ncbi:hypothetical protein MHI37_18175 [Paenibacillus sp. FSL H8-0548]|uniref:hypothetical protein n=1 Tax=Paenibacillus sp. FSL H8-0548 TaxID=1920422 RepID=UPI0015C3CBC7|nr:hypothetical protein [Paenibacillus sp. FSL H8-0548]